MSGLSRHIRHDNLRCTAWLQLSSDEWKADDRSPVVSVEKAVLKSDAGSAGAAESLDNVRTTVAVGVSKSNLACGNRGKWSSLASPEIYEDIAVWCYCHVSGSADTIGEDRRTKTGRKAQACLTSAWSRRADFGSSCSGGGIRGRARRRSKPTGNNNGHTNEKR